MAARRIAGCIATRTADGLTAATARACWVGVSLLNDVNGSTVERESRNKERWL